MELTDSFTEKFLQRRKAAKEYISAKKSDPSSLSKKRAALVEEQQISNQGAADEKESPKRQCVGKSDESEKENVEDEEAFVPFKSSTSRGLSALRRKDQLDLCKDEMHSIKVPEEPEGAEALSSSPVKKKTRLNEEKLIKSDEEVRSKSSSLPHKSRIQEAGSDEHTTHSSRIQDVKAPKMNGYNQKESDILDRSLDPAELPLSARKALFEKALTGGSAKAGSHVLGTKLSVAQRAAMFEKASATNSKPKFPANHGIQKRFFNQNISEPTKPVVSKPVLAPNDQELPTKSFPSALKKEISVSPKKSPVKKMSPPSAEFPLSPSKAAGQHTRLVQQQLVERATGNWQEKEIIADAINERKNEISSLVNHWEQLSSSRAGNSASDEEQPAIPEIPRISEDTHYSEEESEFESEYNESKIESESNEREMESESNEREMESELESERESELESALDHDTNVDDNAMDSSISDQEEPEVFHPRCSTIEEESSNFEENTVDERVGIQNGDKYWQREDTKPAYPVDTSSFKSSSVSISSSLVSGSLSCSSVSSGGSYGTVDSQDKDSKNLSVSSKDSALMYTVSFYRKQKQDGRTPPLKTIIRREQVESESADDNKAQVIQEKIKLLQDEILRQQTVIGQTSQALNLCHATAEFSGSTEQVEGERLLLIATQKRQACLNEIQRLKSHGAQKEELADGTGTLTITGLELPLKREFISAQLEGRLNDAVHCFLCLIRHGAQVIVTQMVSTSDKITEGALCFTNHITLQNLPPDFSVVFEVYALQTKKENLPHDKKYHIKRDHKMRLTTKGKKAEGKLFSPTISSPGGPNAVRTSSFGVVGYTRFNIQNCNRKCFTLDKVPFTSPLDGVLKVKLQLHAEQNVAEKGFLTMFEDVSGFGAWHRRWCYLNAQYLVYWKYPDDEQKKEPIGMIDLKQCITGEVKLVSRDICARPHTFQLVTVRPQEKGDRDTLISKKVNTLTTTKHLLSADTKEERIMWCNKLNEALTNVRKWDPRSLRPIDFKVE